MCGQCPAVTAGLSSLEGMLVSTELVRRGRGILCSAADSDFSSELVLVASDFGPIFGLLALLPLKNF